ncbi:MAG: single-stranded DNA-binding protein [Verrucomicrobiae bacterium]|nr:single-stranded DNA-binding protein [Verrucomicrobiae bacterium]
MPVVRAAERLREATRGLAFGEPVAWVYRPLDYAWEIHRAYAGRFGDGPRRVIFLGMNPGPFGMAQTGVPFGEVAAVRDWMGLGGEVRAPDGTHPKRAVEGFACRRSEVSGRRLWGLFAERYGTADAFFAGHFVVNYCPLLFVAASGANLTPDKLPVRETAPLWAACDAHLREVVEGTGAAWVVGVGGFAADRAAEALEGMPVRIARILHPSPASPAANRGWAAAATRGLVEAGVWGLEAEP